MKGLDEHHVGTTENFLQLLNAQDRQDVRTAVSEFLLKQTPMTEDDAKRLVIEVLKEVRPYFLKNEQQQRNYDDALRGVSLAIEPDAVVERFFLGESTNAFVRDPNTGGYKFEYNDVLPE